MNIKDCEWPDLNDVNFDFKLGNGLKKCIYGCHNEGEPDVCGDKPHTYKIINTNFMRTCYWPIIVPDPNYPISAGYEKQQEGKFHCWGMDALESNDGNVMWTVAIVEDNNGNIHKVLPEKLHLYLVEDK